METIQIRLTENQVKGLDEMVKSGLYCSRGEAVRDAVRRLELVAKVMELQKAAKRKGIKKSKLLREVR